MGVKTEWATRALGCGALVLVAIELGCEGAERVIHVPSDGAESVVLAVEYVDSSALELSAHDLRGGRQRLSPSAEGELDLYALQYDCSLDHLRLSSGALPFAPMGARNLPRPNRVLFGFDGQDNFSGWMELPGAQVPPPLASARLDLPGLDPCASLEVSTFVIPGTRSSRGFARFATKLDDGRVIVGVDSTESPDRTRFFALEEDGPKEMDHPPGLDPLAITYQAAALPGGQIFLLTSKGAYRGSLEGGLVPAPRPTINLTAARPALVAGTIGPGDFELYATDVIGNVERLASTETSTVWQRLGVLDGQTDVAFGLVWIGPRRVTAWKRNSEFLLQVNGERVHPEAPPAFDTRVADYSSAAWIEGLGFVLTTDQRTGSGGQARVHVRNEAGVWVELEPPPTPGEVEVLANFTPGYWYGSFSGVLAQYVDGHGYCPPIADLGGTDIRGIFAFENHLVVTSDGPEDNGVRVFWADVLSRGTIEADSCPRP